MQALKPKTIVTANTDINSPRRTRRHQNHGLSEWWSIGVLGFENIITHSNTPLVRCDVSSILRVLRDLFVVHIHKPYSVAGTGCGAGACSGSRQRESRSIA